MIKPKELKKDDHWIEACVKYTAVLIVKYPKESVYTSFANIRLTCHWQFSPYILLNRAYLVDLLGYIVC